MIRFIQSVQIGFGCALNAWKMLGEYGTEPKKIKVNFTWDYL